MRKTYGIITIMHGTDQKHMLSDDLWFG